ncbi:hypothetical protein FSP39_023135 [Pinctada imbricata]|uniref:B box-type domain-containing protein n=1 Tax=Pinctada imbricata TaxID=66713 RepID=A0AA88Y4H2_PINIB|nr:hypothetical protein FSP39_023135 [Pinctada imbricata]
MAQRMVKCELCDENKDGTWFCKNCHQSLCDKCKKSHQRANVSKHHDIISRNDMFETQGEKARPVDEYCKEHTKEIYILYCKKCNVLICRKCLTEKHSKHDVTEIENVFNENRRKAEKLVRELSGEEAHSDSDGKSNERERLRKRIQEKAAKLKDDVDNAKEEMLSELDDIFGELTKNQSVKEEALKKLNISLQSNRSSELLDAVGFSLSLKSSIAEDERDSSEIQYLPGQYSLSDVQHLLGTISTVCRLLKM